MSPGPVVVIAEHRKGELADISLELLACGRQLADATKSELNCILLAEKLEPFKGLPLAADKLLIIQHPLLSEFNPDAVLKALLPALRERSPDLVLIGNTSSGMDLSGALSKALNATVVGNASEVVAEEGRFIVTSRIYGGKIVSRCEISGGAGIVLLSAGNYPKEEGMRKQLPEVEIAEPHVAMEPARIVFREYIEPETTGVDISKVPVLVAAGRGIESEDNLEMMEELAEALGGAVCGTRPLIDQEWLPRSRQVGRSGMTVKPRLYLALGVSGAPEHVEGMKGAELIVAINLDESAPIFDVAQYGSVADLFDVAPPLIERLKAERGG
jgi:electron transfer flavoprotein alpha subunit